MAFYKICKNGNLIKNKNGEFVDRFEYDKLLRENRLLKKNLTWDNLSIFFSHLLDKEEDIRSEIKFAAHIYLQGLRFLVESSKKTANNDKNQQNNKHNKAI